MVDDKFIDHIIDTRLFQRLRRVEQTSIRAVYPSARHDRFIHSLGVFHIGSLIVNQLRRDAEINSKWGETTAVLEVIFGSYLAACLLHDIAHAPFSHTFEKYYGQKSSLSERLKKVINNEDFSKDLDYTIKDDEPNYHEYASAIVVISEYKSSLDRLGYNAEFIARMITGTYYHEQENSHQIHNCLITLLHGKIIDADRLDYACRDVWASGYSTSSIDVRRLISALHIKSYEGKYNVCFESNSLNEIEGVLNVKDFQVKYALNHHVVNYEQALLIAAAEHMSKLFFPSAKREQTGGDFGYMALGKIVNIDTLVDGRRTEDGHFFLKNVSDDDIIFLMKQDIDNSYYLEWSSREYSHFPLWKSRDEFYHFFPFVSKTQTLKNNIFDTKVRDVLVREGFKEDEIMINEATFKKRVQLKKLFLVVSNDVVKYTDIKPEEADSNRDIVFYYVFVSKRGEKDRSQIRQMRLKLIDALKSTIKEIYSVSEEKTDIEESSEQSR